MYSNYKLTPQTTQLVTKEQPEDKQSTNKAGDLNNFPLSEETKNNLINKGISYLFPIQIETFYPIYQQRDLVGRERTGCGKTLAFLLPVMERIRETGILQNKKLGQKPLIFILAPTRELALQISKECQRFMNYPNEFRIQKLYGGTDIKSQIEVLYSGTEIVVGTPGRILDLMRQKKLILSDVQAFVLDETDNMLDLGFQEDMEQILEMLNQQLNMVQRTKENVQFLCFSATIPKWVDEIAKRFMKKDYVKVDLIKNHEIKTSKTVEHYSIFFQNPVQKTQAIGDVAMVYGGKHSRTIIFTDKKSEANEILLNGELKLHSQVLHGDIPQKQREIVFQSFKEGKIRVLIATNVAARGLDIPKVDLIIQLQPPKDINAYIHRSGRTGRAGNSGKCITFYTRNEKDLIDQIQQVARIKITQIGIPQIPEIVKASARDIAQSFDSVNEDILQFFDNTSEEILSKYSAKEALNRALALISGYTKVIKQRSLLTGTEGYVSFILEFQNQIPNVGFVWKFIKKNFSVFIHEQIKSLKLLQNLQGVVFDIPEEVRQIVTEIGGSFQEGITLYEADDLPLFFESDQQDMRRNNYKNYDRNAQQVQPFQQLSKGQKFMKKQQPQQDNRFQQPNFGNNRFQKYNSSKMSQHSDQDKFYQNKNNYMNQKPAFEGRNYQNGIKKGQNFNQKQDFKNQEKDLTKLFLANMPFDLNESQIGSIFEDKGYYPLHIKIVRNQENQSKGFGYVKFQNDQEAQQAYYQLQDLKIQGRPIKIAFADLKSNKQYQHYIFIQLFIMAYKEQKAQSMFNKWWAMQRALYVRDPDAVAPLIEDCNNLQECYRWRETIMKEIGDKVAEIQNTGMENYKLRALNDQINDLIYQKRQWEKRIRNLGGPDLSKNELSYSGVKIPGKGEYLYFGAAKDLPGVKELFYERQQEFKRDPEAMLKNIPKSYFINEIPDDLIQNVEKYDQIEKQKVLFKWIEQNSDIIYEQMPNFYDLSLMEMIEIVKKVDFGIYEAKMKTIKEQKEEEQEELLLKKKELLNFIKNNQISI